MWGGLPEGEKKGLAMMRGDQSGRGLIKINGSCVCPLKNEEPLKTSSGIRRFIKEVQFRKHLLWFVALAGVYAIILYKLCEFMDALPRYLPIDDSYIILRFARNVVERGELFSYNAGELSTGITSPLYCLALAAVYAVLGGGNVGWHTAVVMLGGVSFIASLMLGGRLAYRMGGYVSAVVFSAFFGFWGYMAFFAFCGMEPILYIALSFGAFLLFYSRNYFLAGLLSGLAMLCRPEAIFFVFALGIVPFVRMFMRLLRKDWVGSRTEFTNGLRLGVGFLIFALPWIIRCQQISGSFLSSTVTMKSIHPSFQQIWNYWVAALHMHNPSSYDASMIRSLAGESTFIGLRKHIPLMIPAACSLFFLRKRPECLAVFMYVPFHLVVTGLKNSGFGDNERYFPLDYAIVVLYLAVLFGFLVKIDWAMAYSSARAKWARNLIRVGSAGTAAVLAVVILLDYSRNIMHYQVMAKYFSSLDYQIGEWLVKNTPPDTCVALFQAGGIAFFGRRRIIDGGGVTEHTIWPYLKRGAFCEAMVERGADYVAPFGDEWLVSEGVHMRDTRFFSPVPLRCRGLYKINKTALAQYVAARKRDKHKGDSNTRSLQ